MITHTSIVDYLNMPVGRFYNVLTAIANVIRKREG